MPHEIAPAPDDGADLLADALDVSPDALRRISREPLGRGSVSGYVVTQPEGESISYVDTSLLEVPQETGLALEGVARVWTHPADPHLPALVPAAFGGALGVLLGRLGIEATGAPEITAYRPGRRAVLSVPTSQGGTAWIKVVRPSRIERIVEAHRALTDAGLPVPTVRGWSPEGLLVIDQAVGTPATHADWDPDELLDIADGVRAALAAAETTWEARTGLAGRLGWYEPKARAAMPAHAGRIAAIADGVRAGLAQAPEGRVVVHGDLHLGQMFLTRMRRGWTLSGLIDADTAGMGAPGEDEAAFLGHAIASALITIDDEMGGEDRIRALAERARIRWATDPHTRALTNIHLIGHALGNAEAGDASKADRILTAAEDVAAGRALRF